MRAGPLLLMVLGGAWVRLFILLSGTYSSIDVVMTTTTYDSNRYVVLADELRAGHGFARPYEEGPVHLAVEKLRRCNSTWPKEINGYTPEGFRTPGYPVFLALIGGHHGLNAALFVQCLLSSLCAPLAALTAKKLNLTRRASYTVGFLWAFHPAMVTTDLLVLTESLFGMIGLAALAVAVFHRGPNGLLLAGCLVGIDGLVRPLGLIYLFPVLILGWPTRRKWLAMCLCLVMAFTPSLLWAWRNAEAGHGFRVSTVSEINLYYYGGSYVLSESRADDWKKAWLKNIDLLTSTLESKLVIGENVNDAMRREAFRIYLEHPTETFKVAMKSQFKLMFDHSMEHLHGQYRLQFESSGVFSDLMGGRFTFRSLSLPQIASMLWMLLNATIALLAALGLLRWLRCREWRLFFGCLMPLLLFSLASFPVGLERFRVPMMLYLFLPACAMVFRHEPRP